MLSLGDSAIIHLVSRQISSPTDIRARRGTRGFCVW